MPGNDRNTALPLYRRIEEHLARDILTGVRKPGERVPSEHDLVKEFSVSRITARQALQELAASGLVVRVVGRGSFVADQPKPSRTSRLAGFGANMQALGLKVEYELHDLKLRLSDDVVASHLNVRVRTPVLFYDRCLKADGVAVESAQSWVHIAGAPLLDSDLDDLATLLRGQSLYGVLADRYDIEPTHAQESVEPVAVADDIATRLELEEGVLALRVSRTVFSQHDRPFERAVVVHATSRQPFRLDIRD